MPTEVGRPDGARARPGRRRAALGVVTVVYLAFVAWMTLRPAPYEPETGELLQRLLDAFARSPVMAWITFDVVEFTANVVMFVPLGILCLVWFGSRRWWTAPLAGFVLSGAIELAQATLLDSRVSDVRDLIANTLGAVVGMAIVLFRDRARSRA